MPVPPAYLWRQSTSFAPLRFCGEGTKAPSGDFRVFPELPNSVISVMQVAVREPILGPTNATTIYSERVRDYCAKAIVLSLFYIVLSIYTLVAKAQTPETQGNNSGAA